MTTVHFIIEYLYSTSEKYAAAECISNTHYILSHTRKDGVIKLWELTGIFIMEVFIILYGLGQGHTFGVNLQPTTVMQWN